MRLQHSLVQQERGSGFRGPDLGRPGLQGNLALPTKSQVEGVRQEDLVIKIKVPSCTETPVPEAIEAQGEPNKNKNEVPVLWSSIIKSSPQVGDGAAGAEDTGLNAKLDFETCPSASMGSPTHDAPPAPGVGEAILRGVGEALPSGMRTGSGRDEEPDVDYSAAATSTCPDDVGQGSPCNVLSGCSGKGVENKRLGGQPHRGEQAKRRWVGRPCRRCAFSAQFATTSTSPDNKGQTRSRH